VLSVDVRRAVVSKEKRREGKGREEKGEKR
jgi:hypothetical protein